MQSGTKLAAVPEAQVRQQILLVEDDPYVAKFIRKRLIVEGFEVDHVANGALALERLTARIHPDLIISDLRMPQINGFELLDAIAKIEGATHIPVLILSGAGSVEERVACLDRGASDYLSKPIDGSELAARVRVHLRNTEEIRRLRREARFDPLTGCLNRRGAIEALQRELDRSRRAGSSLTLMLVDADRFKDINDNYGHAIGDQVLMEIAATLKECLRLSDVVGRLGGDEFVIALPGVNEPLATEIKRRLRDRVASKRVAGCEQKFEISIGLIVDADGTSNLPQLFEAADRAMYSDKNRRRQTLSSLRTIAQEEAAQESLP